MIDGLKLGNSDCSKDGHARFRRVRSPFALVDEARLSLFCRVYSTQKLYDRHSYDSRPALPNV